MNIVLKRSISKIGLRSFILIFLLNIYFIPSGASQQTGSAVIYVGGEASNNYSSIQDGIDDANSGDTVFVYSGIYYENIVLDKSVVLVGENSATTIIDGRNVGNVIKINVDGVTIQNFTIQHSGLTYPLSGINCSSNNNAIAKNIIFNNFYGITLFRSSNNTISENIIEDNDHCGTYMSRSTHNLFENNTIQDHTYNGIGMYDSSDANFIQYNDIVNNNYCGVNIRTSSFNMVIANNFIGNNIGIHVSSSENTIENNFFSNNDQDIDKELITPGFDFFLLIFSMILFIILRRHK